MVNESRLSASPLIGRVITSGPWRDTLAGRLWVKAAIARGAGYAGYGANSSHAKSLGPERHNCLRCMIIPGQFSPNNFSVKIPTVAANVYHLTHNGRGPLKIVLVATKLLLGHKIS